MSARVVATHVWPSDIDEPVSVDVLELDWGGPVDDRHHGERMASGTRQSSVFTRGTSIRNHRQVSIVDTGELAQLATAMGIPRIDPGVIADNIRNGEGGDLPSAGLSQSPTQQGRQRPPYRIQRMDVGTAVEQRPGPGFQDLGRWSVLDREQQARRSA